MSVGASLTQARDRLASADRFVGVARLTLLVVLVNGRHSLLLTVVTGAVTVGVFLEPDRLRWPWPWIALALVHGSSQWIEWWRVDDHVVATTYWLVAVGCSRLARDPQRALRMTARLLVGTIFALAFGWKLFSSQYVSGEFWRYTLARDPRIEWVAVQMGGTDPDLLAADRAALRRLADDPAPEGPVVVHEGPRIRLLAEAMTFWRLAIEGAIAAAFLMPLAGMWAWARPVTLVVFCATTYVLIPVVGFSTLLLTMVFPLTDDRRMRVLLVAVGLGLLVWASVFDAVVL